MFARSAAKSWSAGKRYRLGNLRSSSMGEEIRVSESRSVFLKRSARFMGRAWFSRGGRPFALEVIDFYFLA